MKMKDIKGLSWFLRCQMANAYMINQIKLKKKKNKMIKRHQWCITNIRKSPTCRLQKNGRQYQISWLLGCRMIRKTNKLLDKVGCRVRRNFCKMLLTFILFDIEMKYLKLGHQWEEANDLLQIAVSWISIFNGKWPYTVHGMVNLAPVYLSYHMRMVYIML